MPTDIPILHVPPRLPLGLDDVVGLLDEVLQEHLGRGGDDEGGVVGAVADVVVCVDNFLHAGHCDTCERGSGVVVSDTYKAMRLCRSPPSGA